MTDMTEGDVIRIGATGHQEIGRVQAADIDGLPAGPAGADGKTILNGSGAPGAVGVLGDFYLDTAASAIYGPKTGGGWGSPTSLVGPAGTNGTNGTNGAVGPQGPAGAAATVSWGSRF